MANLTPRKWDPSSPMCKLCGQHPCRRKKPKSDGTPRFLGMCKPCWTKRRKLLGPLPAFKLSVDERARRKRLGITHKTLAHRKYLSDTCSKCGFQPIHMSQLDVHHLDHNHKNNDPSNLTTLCANCHRLEHCS